MNFIRKAVIFPCNGDNLLIMTYLNLNFGALHLVTESAKRTESTRCHNRGGNRSGSKSSHSDERPAE